MRSNRVAVFVGVGLLVGAVSARAHHAFAAEFDVSKPIHFTGVVTKLELVNPHTWIHIDVKESDGTVTSWMIEAGTPNVLLRRGFTKTSVAPGTEVIVDGFAAKDGSRRGSGRDLTLPGGRKLFIGATGAEGPEGEKKQ